ncbi:hypothetical protein PV326_013123 [Microctonus aethiopoides]|nr:hypothetical protein PV326_013123 [Microctonus aethiopoides]
MCTLDVQLHGFKGRCKHRVHMKSKPDKYVLIFKTLNDAETAYLEFGAYYTKWTPAEQGERHVAIDTKYN